MPDVFFWSIGFTEYSRNPDKGVTMFEKLKKINSRPRPFEFYTVEKLYSDVAGTPFDADSTEIAVIATIP